MIVLAVDTSLTDCACCVFDTAYEDVLALTQQSIGRGHAELLIPIIADTLARSGVPLPKIERFAATVGPGSFTGIRVGVAARPGGVAHSASSSLLHRNKIAGWLVRSICPIWRLHFAC
jgi:tRNA threonylcarbamoyladenosine biosynthesis protein TsaB